MCLLSGTKNCFVLSLERQKKIQDLIDISLTFAFIWARHQPKLHGLVCGTLLHPRMHSIPGYRKAFGSNLQHHVVSMRSDLTINKLASLCLVGSTPECDYHVHTCTNKFHQVGKLTFNLNGHSTAVRKHPKIGQTYISKLMDQNSENERCL